MNVHWRIPAQHQNLKEDILPRIAELHGRYPQATETTVAVGTGAISINTEAGVKSFAPYFIVTLKDNKQILMKMCLIYNGEQFFGYKMKG
ncbi:MAG: hypothetical protein ACOC4E_01630 [Patescibacteria group bacterium]